MCFSLSYLYFFSNSTDGKITACRRQESDFVFLISKIALLIDVTDSQQASLTNRSSLRGERRSLSPCPRTVLPSLSLLSCPLISFSLTMKKQRIPKGHFLERIYTSEAAV